MSNIRMEMMIYEVESLSSDTTNQLYATDYHANLYNSPKAGPLLWSSQNKQMLHEK